MSGAVSHLPADLSAWLTDLFIPLWIERTCLQDAPGYVEEVRRSDGAPVITDSRSTMVTGRLLYSFSQAYGFDGSPASLEAARRGLDFLLGACRHSPGHYAHEVTAGGQVIVPHADLYDLAFVLLSLAGFAQATGEHDILRFADEIARRLDEDLEDPLGGYSEPCPSGDRRRQFPQMHLFEAFQRLAALDSAGGWQRRAARIVALAERLVDPDGGIDEWYAADWGRLDAARREREIGHQFEWAWMLYSHADATGAKRAEQLADRLFELGIAAASIPASGPECPIPNAIDADGQTCSGVTPVWPTTELLRAVLFASARKHRDNAVMADAVMNVLFRDVIDRATGLWNNQFPVQPDFGGTTLPTRVLYHLLPCLIAYVGRSPAAT